MSSDELVSSIKSDVVQLLEDKLKANEITPERARDISRYILEALNPHLSEQQIYEIVEHFDEHFTELLPVVISVSQQYEKELHELIQNHVHKLLEEGRITEATEAMRNFELGQGKDKTNDA